MKDLKKIFLLPLICILIILSIYYISVNSSENTSKIILEGTWRYSLDDSKEFIKKEYDDCNWDKDRLIHTNVVINNQKEKENKVIWFRKTFIFPENLMQEDVMLHIPRIPNYHDVYFNGYLIGKTTSNPEKLFNNWNKKYGYFIPKNLIEYGKENTIAIRTYCTYEYGPWGPITIESADTLLKKIAEYDSRYIYIYYSNFIILLAVASYFYFIYTRMKKAKKYLYFSLLCFITGIYYSNYFVSDLPISYLSFQKIVISCMFMIPIVFLLFIRAFSELPLLMPNKIHICIRIILIAASVLICRDLVSYYIFRKYYLIIFTVDYLVIFYIIMRDYFRNNIYIRRLTSCFVVIFAVCGYDIYFAIKGQIPLLGFQLNVYALMCFLGLIAIDLAKEYLNLYTKASTDGLTGLYTQSFLKNELIELTKDNSHLVAPISLVMLDIDYFKKFNDTYGHLLGDEVLKAVALIIQDHSPKDSIVTRYGGEEFAILLKNCYEEEAINICEDIRRKIEKYRFKDNAKINVTISIGVTTWHPSKIYIHPENLIKEADDSLYYSKRHERNKVTHHKTIRMW